MLKRSLPLITGALMMTAGALPASAEAVKLHAAGSLKAAMTDVAAAYSESTGIAVETAFSPSGLLRERIEGGEASDVFASANMRHPRTLESQGLGGPVVLFARNRLCGLTQPGLGVTPETLLERMLSDRIRLGTSTPKADPSGDSAWELFEKAEEVQPGSFAALDAKALQLTGGADSAAAPEGRNLYAWVMTEDRADIFLTYCTNAVLAKADTPGLEIVAIPEALSVGADYGLTLLSPDNPDAARLALFVVSPAGQEILGSYEHHLGRLDHHVDLFAHLDAQVVHRIGQHHGGHDVAAADIHLDLGGDGAGLHLDNLAGKNIAGRDLHGFGAPEGLRVSRMQSRALHASRSGRLQAAIMVAAIMQPLPAGSILG